MAKDLESTMRFKLDIKEFKASIQDARRQISLANAEFKKNTSGAKDWASSITGVEGKIKQLKTTLNSQTTILSQLKKEYDAVAKEMGEDSAEAQKLKVQITNQEAAINKTASQLSQYSSKLCELKAEEKESSSALSRLNSTIDSQKSKLESLKKEYQNAILTYGKNSKEAKSLASEISNLSGELAKNENKLSEAEKSADKLDKSLDDTEKSAKNAANGGFTVLKGALANLVASGIQAAIRGLKKLASTAMESYKEYKEGSDNVIKATGATGQAAENLGKSYKNVAKSVVGDFNEIGSALGEVSTRFGFTDKQLEDCSVQFIKFAKITGTDAVTAVQLVSRAMGDAGVDSSEYSLILDELAAAAQGSGISIDKLTENITKYGAPMRALGFETKESIAIFAAWEKAGVNTEIAFSGMKKAISNWAKDNKDSREEFKKTLEEIAKCPDIAEATTKAIEVFGAKAGPDLADAIKQGRFEYSEFLQILENSEGTVTNTSAQTRDGFSKIKLAIQSAKVDLGSFMQEIMEKYQPQIESAIKNVSSVFQTFVEFFMKNGQTISGMITVMAAGFAAFKITGLITSLISSFSGLFSALKAGKGIVMALNAAMSANPIGLIIALISALVAAFITLWNNSEEFRNFWISLWEKICSTVSFVINSIIEFFSSAWEKIKGVWNAAGGFFSGILGSIQNIFCGVGDWFRNIFSGAWNAIKGVFSSWGSFFGGLWEAIKNKFSEIGTNISNAISGAVRAGINGVISSIENIINGGINLINGAIDLINKIPGVGIGKLGNLNLPRLAKGGVLENGARAVIAGENGAEAIVPLERNKKWISKVAKEMVSGLDLAGVKNAASSGLAALNSNLPAVNTVNSKNEKSQTVIFNQTINSPKTVDRLTLYRETNSLLFGAKTRLRNI